ncbi:hypothetical protein FV232_16175 [Methylobacterium sp. WL30]|jgi:hypothetical protein|uniref:hypothetical protein n=1 Tax=unclassified Methylobacterium TaxID=2615210 RepID=UPI0011C7D660|nr:MULTISPECIES: hypothetical protein [unclassified Methylobacterium]MCJ2009690.1 hypothetical protein [Methylobacterium sp. J-092]MCJ2040295.1 hypothetical protein [Methylobacterium sp. J-059]TXM92666.1 hypothetical protein FV223_11060 [Methylobacterium sp. WL116]TXN40535.1 hypothetical protein FV225_05705 [Methylobacterium sp. WL93]TXN49656.1 hypothetical protein FV227_15645 [Methylobacterium sp. WL119]
MSIKTRSRTVALAAIVALTAGLGSAGAAEIKPAAAGSVDLGTLSGVAYYTAEPKGYRVVVTLAPRAAAPAVRFETVLADDQSVTLSTPRPADSPAETIEISRVGDRILVQPSRTKAVTLEAAAVD